MSEWYYERNGEQDGPIDDETFERMIQSAAIQPNTLVWCEGMANWLPLMQVNESVRMGNESGPRQIICTECGGLFDTTEAVEYAGQWVCAGCKPAYTQRMLETGATVGLQQQHIPGIQAYAGFWIRALAAFIDSIIFNIPIMVIAGIGGAIMGAMGVDMESEEPSGPFMLFILAIYAIAFLVPAIYFIYFHAKKGATPGKMALGIKVVNSDGSPISMGKAIGRFFGFILSYMICYIGLIMAGFDAEKRSLHDMICDTRVIYKPKG